jgi:hypothetical protein
MGKLFFVIMSIVPRLLTDASEAGMIGLAPKPLLPLPPAVAMGVDSAIEVQEAAGVSRPLVVEVWCQWAEKSHM